MNPLDVSANLIAIADYIEREMNPHTDVVEKVLSGILTATSRHGADLARMMDPEVKAALHGMDSLISRVEKVVKTLNPQDPSREYFEKETLAELRSLKEALELRVEDFANVNI